MAALVLQLQLATSEVVIGECADNRIAELQWSGEADQRPVMSWPLISPAFPARVCLDVQVGSVTQVREFNMTCVVGISKHRNSGNFYSAAPQDASHLIQLDLNFGINGSGSIQGLFARNWCEKEPLNRYALKRPAFPGSIAMFVHIDEYNGFQLVEFNPHFVMCVRRL